MFAIHLNLSTVLISPSFNCLSMCSLCAIVIMVLVTFLL